MKIEYGDMWQVYDISDMFYITTNNFIKKDGRLVMGRGMAKQARDKFPNLDLRLGQQISKLDPEYGIVYDEETSIAAFQVKRHFKDMADLNLIENSTYSLMDNAFYYYKRRFDLNYPGIGNGGLKEEVVYPIISILPDNVHVWKLQ